MKNSKVGRKIPMACRGIRPGEHYEIIVSISPRKSAEDGLTQLRFYANSTSQDSTVTLTNSSFVLMLASLNPPIKEEFLDCSKL